MEHTLPIFLNGTRFDKTLLSAPQTQYKKKKEIFIENKYAFTLLNTLPHNMTEKYRAPTGGSILYLKERHDNDDIDIESPNKNFFTNNLIVDIFIFTVAIISAITTLIISYLLCKHNKLRTLVASLVLQQVKEVHASTIKQNINNACDCTTQFIIILDLSISIIG